MDGEGPAESTLGQPVPSREHIYSEESLNAVLHVTLKRVEDCRNESRSFNFKTSVILTADGVLLGIILNSFASLEPITASISIVILLVSAYSTISALRSDMKVFGVEEAWEDLCQNLEDSYFTKLMLIYKLKAIEKENRETLANQTIKWDNSALLLIIAFSFLAISLTIQNVNFLSL